MSRYDVRFRSLPRGACRCLQTVWLCAIALHWLPGVSEGGRSLALQPYQSLSLPCSLPDYASLDVRFDCGRIWDLLFLSEPLHSVRLAGVVFREILFYTKGYVKRSFAHCPSSLELHCAIVIFPFTNLRPRTISTPKTIL